MREIVRSLTILWVMLVGSAGVGFTASVLVSADAVNAGERDNPSVAYNSLHDEYLVVWQNDTTFGIYGQRVSPTGERLGSWFCISCGSDVINPDVAYSRASDKYLVVWQYDAGSASPRAIHGRIIDRFGSGSPWFVIDASTSRNNWYPAVAWNSLLDQFFVVWETILMPSWSNDGLHHRIVNPNGSLGLSGQISTVNPNATFPDVTYNVALDEYLVVWRLDLSWLAGIDYEIGMIPLDSNGLPTASETLVAATLDDEWWPSVTTNSQDVYAIAWSMYWNNPVVGSDASSLMQFRSSGIPGLVWMNDYLSPHEDRPQWRSPKIAALGNSGYYVTVTLRMSSDEFDGVYGAIHRFNGFPDGSYEMRVGNLSRWSDPTSDSVWYPSIAAGPNSFLVVYPVSSATDSKIFALGSFIFTDSFESGDTTAWSATTP